MAASGGLRIRLLEPSVGVVTGGSRLLIHGRGFRPPPHSLLVRFRPLDATDAIVKIDVSGRYLLESQLEVVAPSFENEVKQIVASRTNLAQSSATITSAPQIVRVAVEVILDATHTSNALDYCVHQGLAIRKVSPPHVLMAPPTTATLMLNILKLPSRLAASTGAREQPLAEITSLPVFVRVKHKAERTGVVTEQTRPGRWRVSPQGVFEVEFDAVMLGFGAASVEVTLNRVQFFRGVDKLPESLGYQVHRDALLESVDPCTVNVTSGHATDLRIFGTGFVDTGDLVVALTQRELPTSATGSSATGNVSSTEPVVKVAQLNATFVSSREIYCSVHANMPFGLTTLRVSPNGGKQFGNTSVVALLYRHRPLEGIMPANGSLTGNTVVHICHHSLPLEGVDAMAQVQNLIPPRRVRVRFQALHDDGSPIDGLCKIVHAENFVRQEGRDPSALDRSAIVCRTPPFLDELKALQTDGRAVRFDHDGDVPLRVKHFSVSIALGSDAFTGALSFAYFFPPTIRLITGHHGPATGGTAVVIRMKYKVPSRLPLLVRFLSLRSNKSQVVSGKRFAEHIQQVELSSPRPFNPEEISADIVRSDDDPDCLICCHTPAWTMADDLPHLTKIQVSYDGGVEFFPLDDPRPPLMSPRTAKKASTPAAAQAISRDWSYLYFLFYKTPSFNAVLPMSADIQGGSSIRIMGDHIIDHGGQVTVVFHSPRMSRKVLGFVEKGEVRCCAPPFDVGTVAVYVSFNSEQYVKCCFKDPESNRGIDFVFYSSPSIQSISPLCANISKPSVIRISGINLIETGRIKVRIGFTTHHGKFVHKDVPGKANDGIITTTSPTFPSEFANTSAIVDVALNGNDFTGTTVALHYFSSYQVQGVEPRIGAAEIPIPVSLQIAPFIVTDRVIINLRLKLRNSANEASVGPTEVTKWTSDRVAFTLPALVTYAETVDALLNIFVDVSFDGVSFHSVGDLLTHYRVYNMPHLTSMSPLYGLFDRETEIIARGTCLQLGDTVKISLFLQNSLSASTTFHSTWRSKTPVAVIVGEVNVKRQTLTWRCPRLEHVRSSTWSGFRATDRMILDECLTMQVSVVDGQTMVLPFMFRYYRTPTLVAIDPGVGYTCSGSVVSFEFKELIETPTVDFRFGKSDPSGGRLRDGHFVECFSPELEKGIHEISVSFNEQHYDMLRLRADTSESSRDQDDQDEVDADTDTHSDEAAGANGWTNSRINPMPGVATFEAFPLPVFMVPRNTERVCGFGPIGGGTILLIKGLGFVQGTRIYVRFCSPYRDGLGEGTSDVVVKAGVVDAQTIQCVAPPSLRTGRVELHVSYNLQQFIDSTCYFEYHRPTAFEGRGTLCGPVSGKTPVSLVVQSDDGLPANKALIECSIRFTGANGAHFIDVPASFDSESLAISCVAPAWPANELVDLWVTLACGPFQTFMDSRVQFLFYDPPEGVIRIEPCAGPISGGTNVLAWCGKLVDTGEITVCITLSQHANISTEQDDPVVNSGAADLASAGESTSILVKGTIIGDAVSFTTPPVQDACVAFLNISLNGINYTAIQQSQSLKYVYYMTPVVRRVYPAWCSLEAPSDIQITGDNICDYRCKVLVRFVRQSTSDTTDNACDDPGIVEGQLIHDPTGTTTSLQIQTVFPALGPGFYEVEISLNGQQFSNSHYMSANYGNFSGVVCTSLLPLRVFAAPFFLATSTGPAAGGSTVVLFLAKKLLKLLAKESKCTVLFTPLRPSGETLLPLGLSANARNSTSVVMDPVVVQAEIDHPNNKVTCRAPLLRVASVANVDILLPTTSDTKTSASQMFNSKEKERYYSYESPTITEIFPSCGPVSGNTWLVIEATNVIDTGQIFVRFRSTTNERECAIIPGAYSRRFPDGSLSSSPLIVCRTPEVEFVDKVIVDPVATASNSGAPPLQPSAPSGAAGPTTRRSKDLAVGKARAQMFQTMAEQSVNAQLMSSKDGDAKMKAVNTLRLTRAQPKSATASSSNAACAIDLALGATVLVDFTLNAGEQFIAHSVKFHYYGELESAEIKWSPRHFPTKSLSRASAQARMLTIQLPRAFRLSDFPDRICFRFDGDPQLVLSKRRGSSIILHETSATRELLLLDAPRLKNQATARRRSTISRNSSMSASSASLLSLSSSPNTLLSTPMPPNRPRSKQSDVFSSGPSRIATVKSPAPFIAGKMISASEITCPVPDFSMNGPVKVFISLNAQQFVCLGELHFHSPITIAEDEQFRFCSGVGGNSFTVRSSVSSVLRFVAPHDVTNEATRSKGKFAHVHMKPSKCLQSCREEVRDQISGSSLGQSGSTGSTEMLAGVQWQKRIFCAFHVVLIPHNPALLAKVTVKASQPDSMVDMGSQVPDSNGCCVFEVTDWVEDMALHAQLVPDEGYCQYSCIARRNSAHESEWSTASSRIPIILMQCPALDRVAVVLYTSIGLASSELRLRTRDGRALVPKAESKARKISGILDGTIEYAEIAPETVSSAGVTECDVCAVYQVVADDSDDDEGRPFSGSASASALTQIIISDRDGIRAGLFGEPQCAGVWIAARIQIVDSSSSSLAVVTCDRMLTTGEEIEAPELSPANDITPIVSSRRGSEQGAADFSTIPVKIHFTPADSSVNLSGVAAAKLVLNGKLDIFEFLTAPSHNTELKIECSMPPLPFSGPTNVMVAFGGVMFSNFVCIHCYDPRTWHVVAIEPPCGLVNKAVAIRLKGENFVETNKISVRFADEGRYLTVGGALARSHLLIVRIAAVKNVRALLSSLASSSGLGVPGSLKRDEDKAGGGAVDVGVHLPSSFTLTVRIECNDQKVFASCRDSTVLAAVTSGASLSWEEQFEIQVASKHFSLLVVSIEISDSSLPKPVELAKGVLHLSTLQEGAQRRKSVRLERHFHRGVLLAPKQMIPSGPSDSEMDLVLHLSPLMLQPEHIVCNVEGFRRPETLSVQVSPGGNLFPVLPPLAPLRSFQVYQLPTVTNTSPKVLPRSTGGEITINGSNFIDVDKSGRVWVRLFCCLKTHFETEEEERSVLQEINQVTRLQQVGGENFFVRDIEGAVKTPSSITCAIPPSLATYNIFYRLSFDGREFTEASSCAHLLLFSVHSIDPKGGPISGNTYAALHGINLNACLSPTTASLPLSSLVRLSWMRGARELESVVVTGEFYAPDDTVYFYTPQSRFGLQNIAINVELALVGSLLAADKTSTAVLSDEGVVSDLPLAQPRFSRDEVSFIMYKVPVIRGVAPAASLMPGFSSLELAIQGFDEKSMRSMKAAFKVRFKQRGQMQISEVYVASEVRFDCVVPRFNINRAVATEIPAAVVSPTITKGAPTSSRSKGAAAATVNSPFTGNVRCVRGPMKIWTRTCGIYIVLMGARNLHASKKHTCNPFAILTCGKAQLKSTRKEATFSPIWNEVFDFEWPISRSLGSSPTSVRIVLENQLTLDQSEFIGQLELTLNDQNLRSPLSFRGWLPLRRLQSKKSDPRAESDTRQYDRGRKGEDVAAPRLGELEVAFSFFPPPPAVRPKEGVRGLATSSLRASILSVVSSRSAARKGATGARAVATATPSHRERLLRAFKRKGPPMSLVPTELQIELALNGQDFWSVAPVRCYTLPPPIVVSVEPAYISIAGGTITYVSGLNFVNSGIVRVAFAADCGPGQYPSEGSTSSHQNTDRVIVVDAKYRSSTSLVCVSPSFACLDGIDISTVTVHVCLNGMDFDGIALPQQAIKLCFNDEADHNSSSRTENTPSNVSNQQHASQKAVANQTMVSSVSVSLENDRYVADSKQPIDGLAVKLQPLDYRVRVYHVPKITCVRPTDGTYTSHLTFDGSSFTDTGIAIARFTSTSDEKDVRTSKLEVQSPTQMDCHVPDFPRGTVVRIEVSMNGVEFISYAHELRLFQLPHISEIAPSWVSANSTSSLLLRGINLAAAAASSSSNAEPTVYVAMTRGSMSKSVVATCVDGEVHCPIPRELLIGAWENHKHTSAVHCGSSDLQELEVEPPILIDIRISGAKKELTGRPLPLRIYRSIPSVSSISPMDGPVYGGLSIVVNGKGFVNTGSIIVRFQFFPVQKGVAEGDAQATTSRNTKVEATEVNKAVTLVAPPSGNTLEVAAFVDSPAKFISAERVLCAAPAFPQEGVYVVLVALNGVEFTSVNDATWFLAWQNWQKRKQLLTHDLFAVPGLARDIAVSVASPRVGDSLASTATTVVGTLNETDIERLRRKKTFMLPQVKGANRPAPPEPASVASARRFNPLQEEKLEEDLAELTNPKLLHWHPSSAANEKGQTLLVLLDTLCNSRESQKIICRRLRIVFRMKGMPKSPSDSAKKVDESGRDRLDLHGQNRMHVSAFEITYAAFAQGMRLIFPHALDRDLKSLWEACEGTTSGKLTYESLMAKVMRPIPDHRSASPEPGPTHYKPQFDVVSPRVPAAVVLPQVPEPEVIAGLPSELFINYDTAYKAVKPTIPGSVFRKRKFNTSWCNPVLPGEAATARPGAKSPDAQASAVPGLNPSASLAMKTPCPPMPPRSPGILVDRQDLATRTDVLVPAALPSSMPVARTSLSKESAPRSLVQVLGANEHQQGKSGHTADAGGHRANLSSSAVLQSGTNLFYNDIAPMYLKFLQSKEIQKLMKHAEGDNESDNRPTTRSGVTSREKR